MSGRTGGVSTSSFATAPERVLIGWTSAPPNDMHPTWMAAFGVFVKQPDQVNGHVCYRNELDSNVMVWHGYAPRCNWNIGVTSDLGTTICGAYTVKQNKRCLRHVDGDWMIVNITGEWVRTSAIRVKEVMPKTEENARLREWIQLHTRREHLKKEINTLENAVHKLASHYKTLSRLVLRAREVARGLLDDYIAKVVVDDHMANMIDEAEFKRYKQAGRELASAEHEASLALAAFAQQPDCLLIEEID